MEQLIIGVFEQGFIYAIMALGVYITYKILDFPDLSVDSTFPLGAAVTTVMLSSGKNPLLALVAATLAGAFAGMITGIIHVKFKVRDLLSASSAHFTLLDKSIRIAFFRPLTMYMSEQPLYLTVPSSNTDSPGGFDELQSSTCHTSFSTRETVYGPISTVVSHAGSSAQDTNDSAKTDIALIVNNLFTISLL